MTGNSLPKGWRLVKFGDLVRKVNNRVDPELSGIARYVAGEHMDSDNLSITRWGIVGDGYLGPAFTMRFQPGQVLYGSRRTYLRKVALADFEGICANTTFVLETKSDELLQEFLPHVMSTERFHEHSISKSKGSVNPYINFVDLNDYEFALPPIAEQHRIIALIKTVDQLIDAHREIPFGSQRDAMLLDLLRVNSKGLKTVCLNEISKISYGYTESAFREIIGPKFLRITDIQDGAVDWESVPYCRIDDPTFAKQKLNDGDIVFARTGTVGKSFLVRNPPDAVSASYLIRVQADSTKVSPEFLFLNFQTRDYWKQIHAGKSGSVQGGFNASKLGRLEIPLPPLAKQIEIVDEMAALQNLEMKTSFSLKHLSNLRSGLLNSLLDSGVPNV